MLLAAGTRLGPYEVLGLIGAGGMGEVYKARDTRLDRTVAIKVLPSEVSSDPARRTRFEREAKTIATLSHAHICTLYDIGEDGPSLFLVMEHLEGQTLADALRTGALPIEHALDISVQVAQALSAAHRAGIIHRDLKPGNVMLTKSGVKLLDFGLAKLKCPAGQQAFAATTVGPTRSGPLTGRGEILGTLQYMAPEQLEGREVGAWTDMWALGLVIYEMLTGRKAFEAKTETALIAAILERQPIPVCETAPHLPPALEAVVTACLVKDPEQRWESAHDVALELAAITSAARGEQRQLSAVPPRLSGLVAVPWVIAIFAIIAAAAFALWPRPDAARPVMHVSLPLPADAPFGTTLFDGIAISRDGLSVAYSSEKGIYVRAVSSDGFRLIPGTENSRSPQFSPDGAWLAYGNNDGIYKVPVVGGAPVRLVESPTMAAFVGDWLDGTILLMPSATAGILSVSSDGGATRPVVLPAAASGEAFVGWPQQVGRAGPLIFTVLPDAAESPDDCVIVLSDRAGEGERVVLGSGTFGRYLSTGHLMFGRAGQLLVAPVDLAARRLTGPSQPVVSSVVTNAVVGIMHAAVSETGTLAYVPGPMQWVGPSQLVTIDRTGSSRAFSRAQRFTMLELDLSADGSKVAVRAGKMNDDIHVFDAAGGAFNRVTFEGGNEVSPVWSPDGRRLAYYSSRFAAPGIYVRDVSGMALPRVVVPDTEHQLPVPSSFSPDGRWLVFTRVDPSTGWDIWRVAIDDGTSEPLVRTRWDELNATVSPDGEWLAFQSNEGGNAQAYVARFPRLDDKHQVSVDGGTEPRWSSTQRELFFRDGEHLMVAALDAGPSLRSSAPVVVLEGAFKRSLRPYGFNYAVLPGGQQFVFARNATSEPAREIRLIVNWFEELKAKVPAGK